MIVHYLSNANDICGINALKDTLTEDTTKVSCESCQAQIKQPSEYFFRKKLAAIWRSQELTRQKRRNPP